MDDQPGHEPSYEFQFRFKIDDGELDGLTQQECFVLGYEYSQVKLALDELSNRKDEYQTLVYLFHTENRERIEELLQYLEIIRYQIGETSDPDWLTLGIPFLPDRGL